MKTWWKYRVVQPLHGRLERILTGLVWALPRPVIYWAVIRAWANATQGEYAGQEVGSVTMEQGLRRLGYR